MPLFYTIPRTMNILIIENEELAVKKLQKTLFAADSSIKILGVCDSIKTSADWLEEHDPPDLILMDIELADGKSFEIFNQVEIKSPVIFTTSYDEYALEAFKVNSIDYLLKPVQKEDLVAALKKVRLLKSVQGEGKTMDEIIKELRRKLNTGGL